MKKATRECSACCGTGVVATGSPPPTIHLNDGGHTACGRHVRHAVYGPIDAVTCARCLGSLVVYESEQPEAAARLEEARSRSAADHSRDFRAHEPYRTFQALWVVFDEWRDARIVVARAAKREAHLRLARGEVEDEAPPTVTERTWNILQRHGVDDAAGVLGATRKRWASVSGCGTKMLRELDALLAENGLDWGMVPCRVVTREKEQEIRAKHDRSRRRMEEKLRRLNA